MDALTRVQNPLALKDLAVNVNYGAEEINKFLRNFLFVFFLSYLFFINFCQDIVEFFFDERYASHDLALILGSTYLLEEIYRVVGVVISFSGQTWVFTVFTFLQMLLNFVLNVVFIPSFGLFAAAISTSVIDCCVQFGYVPNSKTKGKDRIKISTVLIYAIVSIAFILISNGIRGLELGTMFQMLICYGVFVAIIIPFVWTKRRDIIEIYTSLVDKKTS